MTSPVDYIFTKNSLFIEETGFTSLSEISEYNQNRFFGGILIFNNVMMKYLTNNTDLILVKCDLGAIYVFDNFVVKIKPKSHLTFLKKIKKIKSDFLEEIIEIVVGELFLIMITKKYSPINYIPLDANKLKEDIYSALDDLDKINLSHKDVSLDNIVYDNINNRYILIDFDMISNEYQKHIYRDSFKNLEI